MAKDFVKQGDVLYPVTIGISVDRLGIECVQAIEIALDKELGHQGFERKTTEKGDKIVFNYWEFGVPDNGKSKC